MDSAQHTGPLSRLLEEAIRHHQAGLFADAERLYREILTADAGNADALHLLGLLAHQAGNNEYAVDLIHQAIAINGGISLYHANLGIVCGALDRHAEAAAAYRAALACDPADAQVFSNLAAALIELGLAEEARAAAETAIRIRPALAPAHSNLGNALRTLGRLAESIDACRTAIRYDGAFIGAYHNLGAAYVDLDQHQAASAVYRAALCINPAHADAYYNHSAALIVLGDFITAYVSVCRSLRLAEMGKARTVFCECMKRLNFSACSDELRGWMIRALSEPWIRPRDLATTAIDLIKRNPAIGEFLEWSGETPVWSREQFDRVLEGLAAEPLLTQLLCVSAIPDAGLERALTGLRAAALRLVGFRLSAEPSLTFLCALARQCFINEYVFYAPGEELALAETLQSAIEGTLASDAAISAEDLALLACYVPLHHLHGASRLLDRKWGEPVEELLALQIREPLAERQARQHIPRLNEIDDEVSVEVRKQYEENPYPRWVKIAPLEAEPTLDRYFEVRFQSKSYRPQRVAQPDILIAGCGTGQHPIETARRFPYARILAVDLSLASLAYAQRKAAESGMTNIEFAQADLLRLGDMGRKFDVIESVGVLHHLRDPLAGMRVLASLLRPGGVFRLGLYSALARRSVIAVRNHVARSGGIADTVEIRRYRKELFALEDGDVRKKVTQFVDFFSTSDARDLLFHVQEHCFSVADIAQWIREFGFSFIGLDVESEVKRSFRRRFPHQGAEEDLDLWRRFEEDNPDTFANMYQFWMQKA